MENNENYIKLKKLAVVLYEEFNGNQSAIMNELVKNNLKLKSARYLSDNTL